ncbi:MAG: MBL fold metallo-hydrolase [Candidatus Binatia bacterium]
MIFSIQSLLVRTRRHLILVDTCAGAGSAGDGPSDDPPAVPYFRKLRSAGVKLEDVDLVLCTHLHQACKPSASVLPG